MGLMRLTLAMAVLLSHLPIAQVKFIGGGLAVQCFFIISGFYMAPVLSGKYKDAGLFYSNRALRLAPSYFVMMAISALLLFAFDASASANKQMFADIYSHPLTALAMAFENIAVFGQELLFWVKINPDGAMIFDWHNPLPSQDHIVGWQGLLVPQSWSLSMEALFYVLAPFLARLRAHWLIALAGASIALRFAGYVLPVDYPLWQGRLFPTSLFLFLFGMLAHRALPLAERAPAALRWLVALAALALVIFMPLLKLPDEASRWLAYIALAIATPLMFAATRTIMLDRWIGDLSYPLYLTHLAVIGVVLTYNPPFAVEIAISASLALSILLLVLIERPVDSWRQRRAAARDNFPVSAKPSPA